MNDFQFYPTPISLARKAWAKFRNTNFIRVLEPSAGNGDLIKGMPYFGEGRGPKINVDCCEIDVAKHATLRSIKGVSIVGIDYMELGNSAIYSHIIQNPPFSSGVHHVLKAWDGMFDGEIVSIINAATLKNPNSREKEHLVRLIKKFGDVEFIEEAFVGDDVERKTNVEIAVVYLRKKSNIGIDIVGAVINDMKVENETARVNGLASGFQQEQELSVPTTIIENFVIVFDSAVGTMREAVIAEARANHYRAMIGNTMADLSGNSRISINENPSVEWVKKEITHRYLELKDRAWANLLQSSKVKSQLSSTALKRMESEFDKIKPLEFTISNIHGFLRGLLENQDGIMCEMVCDLFDLITRFHTENIVFYKGWISNNKQRTCGMRLKKTRFVLPFQLSYPGSSSLGWEAERRLADFDRIFSMLDGKDKPDVGLVDVFKTHMNCLKSGDRVSTAYFDIRFYSAAGTIHFFPRSQEMMDKFNRLVGEHRKWLPPKTESASKDFLRQYHEADKFDKEIRAAVDKAVKDNDIPGRYVSKWNHPIRVISIHGANENNSSELDAAMTLVHERHGISVDFQLQHNDGEHEQLLLIAA